MTWFAERSGQPTEVLAEHQVRALRQVLISHANDPETGWCAVCGLARCGPWQTAYDWLAAAGAAMAEADQWLGEVSSWAR